MRVAAGLPAVPRLLNIVSQVVFVVAPLVEYMTRLVQQDVGVGIDDTSCRMLLPRTMPVAIPGDAKSRRLVEKVAEAKAKGDTSLLAKMWAYQGLHLAPYNIFDFRVSRHRDGPDDFFRNSRCIVQGDCFSGNTSVVIQSDERLTFAACWGHARRKVVEATTYKQEGERLLGMIQALYDVETRAADLAWQDRQALRRARVDDHSGRDPGLARHGAAQPSAAQERLRGGIAVPSQPLGGTLRVRA